MVHDVNFLAAGGGMSGLSACFSNSSRHQQHWVLHGQCSASLHQCHSLPCSAVRLLIMHQFFSLSEEITPVAALLLYHLHAGRCLCCHWRPAGVGWASWLGPAAFALCCWCCCCCCSGNSNSWERRKIYPGTILISFVCTNKEFCVACAVCAVCNEKEG